MREESEAPSERPNCGEADGDASAEGKGKGSEVARVKKGRGGLWLPSSALSDFQGCRSEAGVVWGQVASPACLKS